MHQQSARLLKLCAREFLHAPIQKAFICSCNKERCQNSLNADPLFSSQLQPTYIYEKLQVVECCSILAAAFWLQHVFPHWLKKCTHTRCTSPKIVHPSVKICAPGAGCTLNFGHCNEPCPYASVIEDKSGLMYRSMYT